MIGTLKIWFPERGFGFIESDDSSTPDAFVHASALREAGIAEPRGPGLRLAFDVANNPDGKPYACDLQLAETAP